MAVRDLLVTMTLTIKLEKDSVESPLMTLQRGTTLLNLMSFKSMNLKCEAYYQLKSRNGLTTSSPAYNVKGR